MADNIGNISTEVTLNASKYAAGLKEMNAKTKAWAEQSRKDFGGVDKFTKGLSTSLGGLNAQFLSVAAIGAFGLSLVNAAGKLSDLSDELTLNISTIQQLETVMSKSGIGMQDISTMITKMRKAISEATDGNTEAIISLAKFGQTAQSLKSMTTEQQLVAIAKGITSIQDPVERTSAMLATFGKTGGKFASTLKDIAAAGSITGTSLGDFTNSKEAINALDDLGDGATRAWTGFKRLSTEILGRFAQAMAVLSNSSNTTTNGQAPNIFAMNGLPQQKYTPAPLIGPVSNDAYDAALKAAAANKVMEDALNRVRDSVFASIDPAAKYRNEISKINDIVTKNKLTEEDRRLLIDAIGESYRLAIDPAAKYAMEVKKIKNSGLSDEEAKKAIAAISNPYLFALDPLTKYADEVAKINVDGGLSAKQKADSIKLLAKGYDDVINPSAKYLKIEQDLDALVKISAIDLTGKSKALNDIGTSYRSAYDEGEKMRVMLEQLDALPASANVDKTKYLRSLGSSFREVYDPAEKLRLEIAKLYALPKSAGVDRDKYIRSFADSYKSLIDQKFNFQKQFNDISAKYNVGAFGPVGSDEAKKAAGDIIESLTSSDVLNRMDRRAALMSNFRQTAVVENMKMNQAINEAFDGSFPKDAEFKLQALAESARVYWAAMHPLTTGVMQNFGSDMASNFTDALRGARSFGDAMHNVMSNLAKDILAVIVKQYILKSLFNIAGSAFGITSLGQTTFGGPSLALDGALASAGPMNSGGTYLTGENGPELVVPKSNSFVIPNHILDGMGVGSRGDITNVSIHINPGTAQSIRNEVRNMMPEIAAITSAAVADTKRRGGAYARA